MMMTKLLVLQLTLLVAFVATTMTTAQRTMVARRLDPLPKATIIAAPPKQPDEEESFEIPTGRRLASKGGKSHHSGSKKKSKKSYKKSRSGYRNDAEGELGCRQECSDQRFTVVCEWEAEKKKSKKSYDSSKSKKSKYYSRRLGDMLDYEEEKRVSHNNKHTNNEGAEVRVLEVENGRKLSVEIDNIHCYLGVGKDDSHSSDDYEEYSERAKFPDDFKITIKEAEDKFGDVPDYYKFAAKVKFDDIDNSSVEEIEVEVEVELLCVDDKLVYDDSDIKFSC